MRSIGPILGQNRRCDRGLRRLHQREAASRRAARRGRARSVPRERRHASCGSACTSRRPTSSRRSSVEFELHPLAVEDAIKAHQRSKLERYGDCLFLVFKTARYDDEAEAIEFSEIQLFAGDRFVITVRHGAASALSPVRAQLESEPEHLALGPVAVVHAILDRVVDDYRAGARRARPRHRRDRGRGVLARAHQPGRAHLPPQAPGARPVPQHRTADRAARAPADRVASVQHRRHRSGAVLPRRQRPPAPRAWPASRSSAIC